MARKLSTSEGSIGFEEALLVCPNAKRTTSAPPAIFRSPRREREVTVSMSDLSRLNPARPHHGAQDSRVGSAAAKISGESLFDLVESRMRRLIEDRLRGHDHAV